VSCKISLTTMDEFEIFKWRLLRDLCFEDCEGMWEPLWALRGCYAIDGQSEDERQAFAERAMRSLYCDGLIYFFRVGSFGNINEAADNPNARLDDGQVEAQLRSDWWRTPLGSSLPADHPNIWIAATPEGETAADSPSDDIRHVLPSGGNH